MTSALAAAGFNADLPAQPASAIRAICALLGWVPMLVAALMSIVVTFHPIEHDAADMNQARTTK